MSLPKVLELRVHGVHGTPPHDMLGLASPDRAVQVAGDSLTGFFQARTPAETSGPPLPSGAVREGLLLGGAHLLGAGRARLAASRALAHAAALRAWSTSPPGPGRTSTGVGRGRAGTWLTAALVRLAGLALTALFVTVGCGIGVDLVAWQCFRGGVSGCPALPGVLDVLGTTDPGPRLAAGSLVPLGMLGGLWLLTRATASRYEVVPGPGGAPGPVTVLQRAGMWQGFTRVRALNELHLALGMLLVVAVTALPMARLAPAGSHQRAFLGVLVLAGALLLTVVVTTVRLARDQVELSATAPPARALPSALRWPSLLLLVAQGALLLRWGQVPAEAQTRDLPGVGAVPLVLVLVLFVLAAALVWGRRSAGPC